jgi:3-hydroxyisobutyrate dehydrogenase-like beta-hydroxyacid dehydrogenase
MGFRRIAILSIGEMGFHWARLLKQHGVDVLTAVDGRSDVTRKRAENSGARILPMTQVAAEADLIVSIVVPSAAEKIAAEVAGALKQARRKDALYLDANAISPMTAESASRAIAAAGGAFVDGCIIGSAAKLARAAVYVSGPRAEDVLALKDAGLHVEALGGDVGQASAFKIVYAGLTKGLQALLTELLLGARKFDLLLPIMKRYEESFPGLLDKVGASIAALTLHAGRRAEEMRELNETYRHFGLEAVIAPATRRILEEIAALDLAEPSESGAREGDLHQALELFAQHGLLEKKS